MCRKRDWFDDFGLLCLIFYATLLTLRIFFPATWHELTRCDHPYMEMK